MADKHQPKTEKFKPKSDRKRKAETAPTPLANFILPAPDLAAMEIPPREYVVEPFLPASSLLMVYAERGLGNCRFSTAGGSEKQ